MTRDSFNFMTYLCLQKRQSAKNNCTHILEVAETDTGGPRTMEALHQANFKYNETLNPAENKCKIDFNTSVLLL